MSKNYAIHDMTKGALAAVFSTATMIVAPLVGYTLTDAKALGNTTVNYADAALSQRLYKPAAPKPGQ